MVPVCAAQQSGKRALPFSPSEMWISHSTTNLSIWKPGARMSTDELSCLQLTGNHRKEERGSYLPRADSRELLGRGFFTNYENCLTRTTPKNWRSLALQRSRRNILPLMISGPPVVLKVNRGCIPLWPPMSKGKYARKRHLPSAERTRWGLQFNCPRSCYWTGSVRWSCLCRCLWASSPKGSPKCPGIVSGFQRLGKWLLPNVICSLFQSGNHSKGKSPAFQ